MKKNLIIILSLVVIIILVGYGRVQGLLPLKIGARDSVSPILEQAFRQDVLVFLKVGDKEYEAKIKAESTAYDLIKKMQAAQVLKFSAKEYAGMGALIEEINGIKNDIKTNNFWMFYVNGELSPVGASSYILKNNDVISWKYETPKF